LPQLAQAADLQLGSSTGAWTTTGAWTSTGVAHLSRLKAKAAHVANMAQIAPKINP